MRRVVSRSVLRRSARATTRRRAPGRPAAPSIRVASSPCRETSAPNRSNSPHRCRRPITRDIYRRTSQPSVVSTAATQLARCGHRDQTGGEQERVRRLRISRSGIESCADHTVRSQPAAAASAGGARRPPRLDHTVRALPSAVTRISQVCEQIRRSRSGTIRRDTRCRGSGTSASCPDRASRSRDRTHGLLEDVWRDRGVVVDAPCCRVRAPACAIEIGHPAERAWRGEVDHRHQRHECNGRPPKQLALVHHQDEKHRDWCDHRGLPSRGQFGGQDQADHDDVGNPRFQLPSLEQRQDRKWQRYREHAGQSQTMAVGPTTSAFHRTWDGCPSASGSTDATGCSSLADQT